MGYKKSNPLKMMGSALKMYKAEKKGGMHRMESPMYAEAGSSKGMPRLEDRVQRRQDKVDASRATFGTDNVDGGFDRKLKRLKKSVAKSEDRGMNLNYDTTNASGEGYSRETVALNRESSELKDMPIVDIEKGDAKGSPMEKSGARENHGYHMQTGSDNTQPKGARTDTPSEYWRKHQMAADGHHRSKKPSPAQMQGDLDKDGKMSSYEGKRQAAIEKNMKK